MVAFRLSGAAFARLCVRFGQRLVAVFARSGVVMHLVLSRRRRMCVRHRDSGREG